MSQIKFVYFDVGDVAFNWRESLRKIAIMANKSYKDVLAVFGKYDDDVCRGKLTAQELWQHFKTELKINAEIENFLEWWANNFSPILPIHRLMEETSRKYRIGVFTNIYSGAWTLYTAKGFIPDIPYAAIIKSCDIGFVKPEIGSYKYAEDNAGVSSQRILLIDNSQKNIDKARELGWQTILYDVNNPQKSVTEIKEILKLK
jgi:putative hydrolase of the HAD superfamily